MRPDVWRRRIRSALLGVYRACLHATGRLPAPLRQRADTWMSYVLLSVANAPRSELEARYARALDVLVRAGNPTGLGDYLEFGVSFGASLACMSHVLQRRGLTGVRLFGFDSFAGLPPSADDEDGGYWAPRMFTSDLATTRRFLARAGADLSRIVIVPGWFDETLTPDRAAALGLRKASLIMMDCDMYSSARDALAFCTPLIRDEAVIIFDDWYSGGLDERNLGEKRAFDEWLAGGAFEARSLGRCAPNAHVVHVVRARGSASGHRRDE